MLKLAVKLVVLAMLACAWMNMSHAAAPLDKLGNYFGSGDRATFSTEEILDPDRAFVMSKPEPGAAANEIKIQWDIAEGYYLYRDRFRFSVDSDDVTLGDVVMPAGVYITEPELGKVEIYRNTVSIKVNFKPHISPATALLLNVVYQGCKENTVCYPPINKTLPVMLSGIVDNPAGNAKTENLSAPLSSPEDAINRDLRNNALWLNLVFFLGFGLLLAFTPCILPMLPILSGIIVGQGHSITMHRAFMLSLSYVLAMATTYALLGVIVAALHFNIQAAAQNAWVISVFSGIFVLLALSMFGFYEMQVPTAWQHRLSEFGIKRQGHVTGAAVMGSMSAIIVGPCIAPPLAGALLYVSQTGNVIIGGAALFALGLGMGLPLLVLGSSAGRLLPRAGAWMNSVKRFFGVILLGVAIWFLERVVPPQLALFIWGSLVTVSAVYIGAFDKLAPDATWHKLWKGAGIIMLVYGLAMIVGAAQGNGDKFHPLRITGMNTGDSMHGLAFKNIKSDFDLDQALLEAARNKQTVMLDFYADWCVTCKEMEKYTFSNAAVQAQLQNVILLQADVTANDSEDRVLLERFDIFGPPAILFFIDGKERRNYRVIGYVPAEEFIRHVRKVITP